MTYQNTTLNLGQIFDTRDLVERIEELEADIDEPGALNEDELEEYKELSQFATDLREISADSLEIGNTVIPDSSFEDYAEELASEISDYNPNDAQWPFTHIDWEAAADDLKQDYSCVTFHGEDYWVRS